MRFLIKLFYLMALVILIYILWKGYKGFSSFFVKEEKTTINQSVVLQEIESLGKLELVKYHFKDVVEFEKEEYSWLPSSKVVLIAGGEAVGCIDLRKIRKNDVAINKDTVFVYLPEPELCYFKIDHEKSRVFDLQYTYFQDKNLIDQAYREAEKQLKKTAIETDILGKTKQNAELILRPILEKITNKKVMISFPHAPFPSKVNKN